jgi:alanyl-tRNA synthetase
MPLPSTDTVVTYPDGDTTSSGTVLHAEPLPNGRTAVLLDRTAFHPVDTAWPDQPADRGVLRSATGSWPILEGLTGGITDGRLALGAELPVRIGTPGWAFVVAHVIAGPPPAVGETVDVAVDEAYRASLSAGHTACHLASLALDAALADAWSKAAPTDALGSPAFDRLAIQSSRIGPDRSTDVYRIGKSLRRKGFRADALDDLGAAAERANAILADWVAAGGSVRVVREDPALSARRTWVCALPAGVAEIPCGGTHVAEVGELAGISVTLRAEPVDGGAQVVMETETARRSG